MKRHFSLTFLSLLATLAAEAFNIGSPAGNLVVDVNLDKEGHPQYNVTLDGKTILRNSPLGFESNIGSFTSAKSMTPGDIHPVADSYSLANIKTSKVDYQANEATIDFKTPAGNPWSVTFRVANNDIAFRYNIPRKGNAGSIYISSEATGYRFPTTTTTFLCPQSDAMIGWKRTKPSYEEEYNVDAPMDTTSMYGHGYTFPCLFKVGGDAWVLLSETGVDSRYCGSHLSDYQRDGLYTLAFPMPEENNGNGNTGAAMALPGSTPWRTITVGSTLAPIVETTAPWDNVSPRYDSTFKFAPGRGTWSWILWQDESINKDDQKRYIDLAKAMGYQYVLVDNWWDNNIGRDGIKEVIDYAHSQGIDVFLWYSSSGYWNDIEQGPINCMDNPIVRKREMRWMRSLGVKGIKVDFFGGDKQETMRLYEAILSDADDNGLMVIFHGCTIPRGWERMYPNYAGSEAVLASENMVFSQHFCDNAAFNATIHPFMRNAIGNMEFGGTFLNTRLNRGNNGGSRRVTTDACELATAILFQNPIQNFALAPNNLTDAAPESLQFMRDVPTTWDETRFIDGYPGRYVVLARRHGDTWYLAGVNATAAPMPVNLSSCPKGTEVTIYTDTPARGISRSTITTGKKSPSVTMQPRGGFVAIWKTK